MRAAFVNDQLPLDKDDGPSRSNYQGTAGTAIPMEGGKGWFEAGDGWNSYLTKKTGYTEFRTQSWWNQGCRAPPKGSDVRCPEPYMCPMWTPEHQCLPNIKPWLKQGGMDAVGESDVCLGLVHVKAFEELFTARLSIQWDALFSALTACTIVVQERSTVPSGIQPLTMARDALEIRNMQRPKTVTWLARGQHGMQV